MIRHDQSTHHAPHIERFDHDLRHPQHGPQPESPHRGGTLRTWEHDSTTEVMREEIELQKSQLGIFVCKLLLVPCGTSGALLGP